MVSWEPLLDRSAGSTLPTAQPPGTRRRDSYGGAGFSHGGSDESHPPDMSAVGGKEALKPQVGARKATLLGSPDLRPC